MDVRRATTADVDLAAPLFNEYRVFYGQRSDPTRARSFLLERLERDQSVIFIASDKRRAAGFTQLYPSFSSVRAAPIFVLNDLFVGAEFRRCRVGAALLAIGRDFARSSGAAYLSLTTGISNIAAQSLYESAGWKRDTGFVTFEHDLDL